LKLKSQGGRPSKKPSNEILEKLYIDDGLTGKEIAKKYGVSESTVRGWIYQIRKSEREGSADEK
jgi:transposase